MKGIIVGNGVTDFNVDAQAALPHTLFGMNIITKNIYEKYSKNKCSFSFKNVLGPEERKDCIDVRNVMAELAKELSLENLYKTP